MLAALVAGTGVFHLVRGQSASAANTEIYKQLDLFGDVLERVRTDYVEAPDDAKLIESAINGMLTSLDPHSAYLNAKHFREMQVQTRGEFGGLGIEVTMENGVVKVVAPIDDTPASRAGILSGDLITHLDGEGIMGLTLGQAVDKMRGPVNSPINLTIVRKGKDEPFDVKIVRDVIRINSVRYNAEGDVGFIRITTFNEQTYKTLKKAVKSLDEELGDKLKGYILDLRNNPGGLLDQAIAVSDAFLDKGAVVLTRGRNLDETPALQCPAGRFGQRSQACGAHQWRLRISIRNCCRCATGSQTGDHYRHEVVWQRFGANHYSIGQSWGHPAYDRSILHPFWALNPGQGYRSECGGRAGVA